MNQEVKNCQNCKNEFTIEPEDFLFYEKMKVPSPKWCHECQTIRRFLFRNERSLYKKKELIEGKEIISMYAPDSPYTVYTHNYWWSDKWDPLEYGMDYDFSRPFFEQFRVLMQKIPWPPLFNWNAVSSDYGNFSTDNKNCFLVFGGDFNENCLYSKFNFHSRDSLDLFWVEKNELGYENIDCENVYKVSFSQYAYNCQESAFLYDCVNCQNCVGCTGLRNKNYCIFNQPYSKEDWLKKLQELNLNARSGLKPFGQRFDDFRKKFPHRHAIIVKSVNSTGNNIYNAKNCQNCFDVHDSTEDSKNLLIAGWEAKDARNADHIGHGAELAYDSAVVFSGAHNVAFSLSVPGCREVRYAYNCQNSSNLFGCISLRAKSYCILNKQYTKEEYEKLTPRITAHMQSSPYKDKLGREYTWGDFLPSELSPFAYNETIAQEDFPLTKAEALAKGFRWREPESRNYKITRQAEDLPDTIAEVDEKILQETIACLHKGECLEQCTTAFRLTATELCLYKKMNLPLPQLCSNCRHYQRLKKRNPYRLWYRKCQCAGAASESGLYKNQTSHSHKSTHCLNEFGTSYAPDRPELVYCEQCYQNEVV